MICPACGYSMDSFDQECPRCHGKGLAVKQPQSPHPNPHQNPPAPPTQAAPTQYAPPQQGYPQGYPPQPPAAPSTNSGVPTALIVVLGVVGGIFLLPFLFVMLIGGMTLAGKNISNSAQGPAYSSAENQRAQCQSRLKQLTLATFQYSQDHNETYPDLSSPVAIRAALDPYVMDKSIFTCVTNHQAYQGNAALAKMSLSQVGNPATTVLFYEADAKAAHPGGSNIAYADGSVRFSPQP